MRHGKKFNHLSRTGHRKSMLANMACSLLSTNVLTLLLLKTKALKTICWAANN
jgi:large subunit ribosomal protein L17